MNQEQEISNEQEELLKHEKVLIEYLSIVMNKDFETLNELFHPKVIAELVFMIDQEVFSDLIVREHTLEEVLLSLKDFLSNKGVPFEVNLEPLMNEQRKDRINFLIDLIVMVKIFNLNQFTYYESLFEPEFKIFFNEMILYSEDQLKGRLNNGTQAKTIQGFSHQEMQKEMQEKLLLREEITALEAERDKVVLKNNDLF